MKEKWKKWKKIFKFTLLKNQKIKSNKSNHLQKAYLINFKKFIF
jgi:hypothetical protein